MKDHINIKGMTPLAIAAEYDTVEFENRFAYRGKDLGANYSPKETLWKLWSPAAERVELCLYTTGSDIEEGADFLGAYTMEMGDQGVWSVCVSGDCKNVYYTYRITVDGHMHECADPYSRAVGVNGRRSMVVDLSQTNPEGWQQDEYRFTECNERAIVWEVHVRDFSHDKTSGMKNKGKFLAFTEEWTRCDNQVTGLDYLKDLGITHVQLLPVSDYATVDETCPETKYNWGYDQAHYNVPEGSYATDPYHGQKRILEFKQMVLALHKKGIGVIMDVVYNHTYETEKSIFQKVMPYYYHRIWKDGTFANGSGCGNEIASERYMVRRYIIDSILYWAKEYHIDGFRLDLMGLLDVATINEIRRELDTLPGGKNILMYGEPWWALPPSVRADNLAADRDSIAEWVPGIGYFNDVSRDAVKGHSFEKKKRGFASGGGQVEGVVRMALGEPEVARQIQYISCHDNYTIWDKITDSVDGDGSGYDAPELIRVAVNKLAATALLCSSGTAFLMAGEEFGRTKHGDGNSYNKKGVNDLDWSRIRTFSDLFNYYKGLIAIRREYIVPMAERKATEILVEEKDFLAWKIATAEREVLILLNAGNNSRELAGVKDGAWRILANERWAGLQTQDIVFGTRLYVQPRGVIIAVRDKQSVE